MYTFPTLAHTELPPSDKKELVFKQSEALSQDDFVEYSEDLPALFGEHLAEDEDYYVLHDYAIQKKQEMVFLGHAVIAQKNALLAYVTEAAHKGNIRPMRVLAMNDPAFIIIVNDEGAGFLYEK